MVYVYLIIAFVAGFFLINGIGKIAIELYVKNKITFHVAYFIAWLTFLIWYIYALAVASMMAFNINPIVGWIVSILWAIPTVVVGVGQLGKDTRRSMDLAKQRKFDKG